MLSEGTERVLAVKCGEGDMSLPEVVRRVVRPEQQHRNDAAVCRSLLGGAAKRAPPAPPSSSMRFPAACSCWSSGTGRRSHNEPLTSP